ncbi:MAG: hypothetical protein WBA24_19030, partial [Geitlerinemataceae cyanobacterium]
MTNHSASVDNTPIFLSEIFPITAKQPKLISFRLTPEIDRELGNRLSWRFCSFSSEFSDLVVIWHEGYFYGLVKPDRAFPASAQWKEKLENIAESLKSEIGDRHHSIQWVKKPQLAASIIAQLAVRILKIEKSFLPLSIWSENRVEVRRDVDFWAETVELQNDLKPAIALTIRSSFIFQGNLNEFYDCHPYRHQPQNLLVGLKVRDRERGSSATIVDLAGTIGERRAELIQKATGAISKQSLLEAPDEQPIVSVRFGKDRRLFDYPLAALIPRVTEETAERFNIQYGELLKASKMAYSERQRRLNSAKKAAKNSLSCYIFELGKSINSQYYRDVFFQPDDRLANVSLLFGKNIRCSRNKILKGLSDGGLYHRQKKYNDRPILISVLKVGNFTVKGSFLNEIDRRLQRYG